MARLRYDNISSAISSNLLTFTDGSTTTGGWDSDPFIPNISSGDYIVIVVNPDTTDEEITYLNGPYTTGDAAPSTFTRGEEGTTGIAASEASWHHGPTALDDTAYFNADDVAVFPGGIQLNAIGPTFFSRNGDPNTHVTANAKGDVCIDEATPAIWQAGAASDTDWVELGAGGEFVPIGDSTGSSTGSTVLSLSANDVAWTEYATATSAVAWGITADDFPRITIGADGTLYFGDGTFDPTTESGSIIDPADGDLIIGTEGTLDLISSGGPIILNGPSWFVNAGDPNGTATSSNEGDICIDTTTPGIWQSTEGGSDTAWVPFATGGFPTFTGSGSPEGSQVGSVADTYLDTTAGGFYSKLTGTATDTGWMIIGGTSPNDEVGPAIIGIGISSPASSPALEILTSGDGAVIISDVLGLVGSGNGVAWNADGTDGDQFFQVITGPDGSPTVWTFSKDGGLRLPSISTANAPEYGQGALYWDNTTGKLTVGGLTTFETILSGNGPVVDYSLEMAPSPIGPSGMDVDFRAQNPMDAINLSTGYVDCTQAVPSTAYAPGAIFSQPSSLNVTTPVMTNDNYSVSLQICVFDLAGTNAAYIYGSQIIDIGDSSADLSTDSGFTLTTLAGTDITFDAGTGIISSTAGGVYGILAIIVMTWL